MYTFQLFHSHELRTHMISGDIEKKFKWPSNQLIFLEILSLYILFRVLLNLDVIVQFFSTLLICLLFRFISEVYTKRSFVEDNDSNNNNDSFRAMYRMKKKTTTTTTTMKLSWSAAMMRMKKVRLIIMFIHCLVIYWTLYRKVLKW